MKKKLLFICLYLFGINCFAQTEITPDTILRDEIINSGFIHRPLPLNSNNSYEANELKKKINKRDELYDATNINRWEHSGQGKIFHATDKTISGNGSLKLVFPTFTGKRAVGSPSDPDYATWIKIL